MARLWGMLILILLISGCINVEDGRITIDFGSAKEVAGTIKEKTTEKIEKIPTPSKAQCKELAKELIPQYVPVVRQLGDYEVFYGVIENPIWKDGAPMNAGTHDFAIHSSCLRHGEKEGENVNYLYPTTDLCPSDTLSYSKQIINSKGEILGYRSFSIQPTLKPYTSFLLNASWHNDIAILQWDGFDKGVFKDAFGTEKLKILVKYQYEWFRWMPICEKDIEERSGIFECDTSKYRQHSRYFFFEPDVFNNPIYEVVEFNIQSCNWVTDQGEVIR